MAKIAITVVDQPDGKVDIKVYVGEIVEGAPLTVAQKLAKTMMIAAADADPDITDAVQKH